MKTEGVGIFVAHQWVEMVSETGRHSERITVIKIVLNDKISRQNSTWLSILSSAG